MTMISVVVCTYNRAALLKYSLETLFRQTLPPRAYEIIVVDNNSTDNTKEVALSFANREPVLSYFHEASQGLSHARNRGWREAKGTYVGYFDDDSRAPGDWLRIATETIERQDSPHVFGGPYYPYYMGETPRWFREKYNSMSHGQTARALGDREFLSGSNIFFRADVLREVGGFETNLGMLGYSLGFGEETRLIIEARQKIKGLRIFYEPRLFVTHLAAAYKMDWSWILKKAFVDGRCYQRLQRMRENVSWPARTLSLMALVFWGTAFLVDASLGSILRSRRSYPYWQNYVFERSCRILRQVGRSYENIVAREAQAP